ncbi:MAG: gliding motility-associated ABC transporter substrate-binding protein GldG [Bacteroidetes bacterium]|nr:gliding motility-associated ABC transporter substrate-binding protein GldG [Bacteroidota bacterium]
MKKRRDLVRFALFAGILILLNFIGSLKFFRIDLTAEGRYSLSEATIQLLESFDDVILVKVYLDGEFPAGFQRMQLETKQMLDEFRAYNPNIQYTFIDPTANATEQETQTLFQQLQTKGLKPYQLSMNQDGGSAVKTIFPGAILSYGENEIPTLLLKDQLGIAPEQQINSSIENLEFSLANSIRGLVSRRKPLVGFLQGHEELGPMDVADFARELSTNYQINKFNIREFKSDSTGQDLSLAEQQNRMNRFDALIIAKPQKAFNDLDKYLLDQYVMNGGKTIWLLDGAEASMDSLSAKSQFMSLPLFDRLQLNDLLFKYGVRVNTDLVGDLVAAGVNDQRKVRPWIYFPMVMAQSKHPIVKDLNAVWMRFASSLDTVSASGVKKTIILRSSPYSVRRPTPHIVSLADLYQAPPRERFREQGVPLGILLEGKFQSLFTNRIKPREGGEPLKMRETSPENQMLIIGDGDVIQNQLNVVNPNIQKGMPLPLGYDQYTGTQYGNKDLLVNAIDYMLDDSGLIEIRSRELKIRLLDLTKAKKQRLSWQLVNTLIPTISILLLAVVNYYWRRRKYLK